MTTLARWNQLWHALGVTSADEALFCELIAKYDEPHRHYHTVRHLSECLQHLDDARALAQNPAEVELALWFHDAHYDVRRQDNEERSANWAYAAARDAALPPEVCERVRNLVEVTRHDAEPQTSDEALLLDIDLSILGSEPQRFDEYERAIREEYHWVPKVVFNIKRRSLLEQFLAREPLYRTEYFAQRLERQARANLQRSVGRSLRTE
jgi:predicted metal-dependent HD superfamily phosphohydrolase